MKISSPILKRIIRHLAHLSLVGTLAWSVASVPAQARPFAYEANSNDRSVSVIDVATNQVVTTIDIDGNPQWVAISPARASSFA